MAIRPAEEIERGGLSQQHCPRAVSPEQLAAIRAALEAGASKAAVCRTFGVKRTTLYDALARVDVSPLPSVEGSV